MFFSFHIHEEPGINVWSLSQINSLKEFSVGISYFSCNVLLANWATLSKVFIVKLQSKSSFVFYYGFSLSKKDKLFVLDFNATIPFILTWIYLYNFIQCNVFIFKLKLCIECFFHGTYDIWHLAKCASVCVQP